MSVIIFLIRRLYKLKAEARGKRQGKREGERERENVCTPGAGSIIIPRRTSLASILFVHWRHVDLGGRQKRDKILRIESEKERKKEDGKGRE